MKNLKKKLDMFLTIKNVKIGKNALFITFFGNAGVNFLTTMKIRFNNVIIKGRNVVIINGVKIVKVG